MMNSQRILKLVWRRLAVSASTLALVAVSTAQVQTQTSETAGAATQEARVERGEVAYVSGNDLIVKMEDGSLRHFSNVPDDVTVTVDGKELTIHDLQPGMKLERTTITSTTPKTIRTVETVSGKVWQVSPPNSVILTLENGKNQKFKIPKGQKFKVGGQETDAWGLKKGMSISATRITEVPYTVAAQEVRRTGSLPPAATPAAEAPLLIEEPDEATQEIAAAEPPPQQLPHTGSVLPLIGLLGLLSTGAGASLCLLFRR